MESVKNQILATLDASGGVADWVSVRDALPFREQAMMPRALREMKRRGIAQAQNRIDLDGNVSFVVFRLPRGDV